MYTCHVPYIVISLIISVDVKLNTMLAYLLYTQTISCVFHSPKMIPEVDSKMILFPSTDQASC